MVRQHVPPPVGQVPLLWAKRDSTWVRRTSVDRMRCRGCDDRDVVRRAGRLPVEVSACELVGECCEVLEPFDSPPTRRYRCKAQVSADEGARHGSDGVGVAAPRKLRQ